MRILDRYVLRNFLEPFLMCFTGFIAIWVIIDLMDNFNEFLEVHASFKTILGTMSRKCADDHVSMPVALMLALLFSLSRMSRYNEIISQLTAGRSLIRVLMPLILFGVALRGSACG